MSLSPQIKMIIEKHIGWQVYLVYIDPKVKGVKLLIGNLLNTNQDSILVSTTETPEGKIQIPYVDDKGKQRIVALYNKQFVNLLNPTKRDHLAQKLRDRNKSTLIISTIKPYLKKIISVIYKQNDRMHIINGEFSNMGMSHLNIKPGPFFNNEDTMPYSNIYHIFDEDGKDLIDF